MDVVIIQFGDTPLHTAAKSNSKECAELLLSHSAEVNINGSVSNLLKKEMMSR